MASDPRPTVPSSAPAPLRLYTPRQVLVAAFLGSPLAAGWLLSRNLARTGRPRDAAWTIAASVGLVALALLVGLVLPDALGRSVPIALAGGCYLWAKSLEDGLSAADRTARAPESWWKAVGTGLAVFLAVLVLIAIYVLVAPDTGQPT